MSLAKENDTISDPKDTFLREMTVIYLLRAANSSEMVVISSEMVCLKLLREGILFAKVSLALLRGMFLFARRCFLLEGGVFLFEMVSLREDDFRVGMLGQVANCPCLFHS